MREGCYAGLLAMVSEETWRHAGVRLADQLVLNRYFAGRRTLVNSTWNYPIPQAGVIRAREMYTSPDLWKPVFGVGSSPGPMPI